MAGDGLINDAHAHGVVRPGAEMPPGAGAGIHGAVLQQRAPWAVAVVGQVLLQPALGLRAIQLKAFALAHRRAVVFQPKVFQSL